MLDFPWIPLSRNKNDENISSIENNVEKIRDFKRKSDDVQETTNVITAKRAKITDNSLINGSKQNIVYSSYNSDEEAQNFDYSELDDIKDDFIMISKNNKEQLHYEVTPALEKENLFLNRFFSLNNPLKSTLKAYKEAKYVSENNFEDIESSPTRIDFTSPNSIESIESDNISLCTNEETGYSFIREKFISPSKKEDFVPFQIKLSRPASIASSPKHSYIEGGLADRAFKISNAFKKLKNNRFTDEEIKGMIDLNITRLNRSHYNHSFNEQSACILHSSLSNHGISKSIVNTSFFCSSYISILGKVIFHENIPLDYDVEIGPNQIFKDLKMLIKNKLNSLYISKNNNHVKSIKALKKKYCILASDSHNYYQINVPHYLIKTWLPVFSKNNTFEFKRLIVKKLRFSRDRQIYNTFMQNGSSRDTANVIFMKKDRKNSIYNEPSFPASQLSESDALYGNSEELHTDSDQITKYLTKFFVLEVSLNSSWNEIIA